MDEIADGLSTGDFIHKKLSKLNKLIKVLKETITKYGFDSLYEITNEYINKAGFINIS
jgi:hypothetical protein